MLGQVFPARRPNSYWYAKQIESGYLNKTERSIVKDCPFDRAFLRTCYKLREQPCY